MKQLINYKGELSDITSDKLSANFSVSEFECDGHLLIARPLIDLLQKYRSIVKKPVTINSGYRTPKKQSQLKKSGFKTANTSPHLKGMAADIDTLSFEESNRLEEDLHRIANEMGIQIRTGNKQYQRANQTFVHVDVCPMFYAKGKPYYREPHPTAWETCITW